MNAHPYNLRSRLSSTVISVKTPTRSPLIRTNSSSPRKSTTTPALQLQHVIGTTTTNPSGLSSCSVSNSYAYCAGAVAVLATIDQQGSVSYRYFKARPTAVAVNSTTPYYETTSASNTPTRKNSVFSPRKGQDSHAGSSFGREWLDDTSGQTWSARERIKTATCVSLSPDGRMLAVGETGYNPRVLLFSTGTSAASDVPLAIITEHTFGVRSVTFSPDSRYLATLGDVNDGFLYIWAINSKTGSIRLHSTNKCTTNVCDMTWCGSNVITVGTRHVKVWQVHAPGRFSPSKRARLKIEGELPASPRPIPLQGRNCLLGKLVDATFTAIVAVSDNKAVVCVDDGQICTLDLSNGKAELCGFQQNYTAVAAISFRHDQDRVVWPGEGGELEQRNASSLNTSLVQRVSSRELKPDGTLKKLPRPSLLRESLGLYQPKRAHTVALACLKDYAVCIDAEGIVRVVGFHDGMELEEDKLSSHNDPVRGIEQLPKSANLGSFFTWARNGEIRFWNLDGALVAVQKISLEQTTEDEEPGTNELKLVHYAASRREFVTGDRYGVIKTFLQDSWSVRHCARSHSAEVTDIDFHDSGSVLATGGRDHMVQLFQINRDEIQLLQTSDDHISAVNHVCFNKDGSKLISCSSDRTVVVRDRIERGDGSTMVVAYLSTRVITLKASPLSMCLLQEQQNLLLVSTMDRHVVKLDIVSGAIIDSFKVSDRDTDDTAILNTIRLGSSSGTAESHLLAGYSSIDKSVRVYDLNKGVLLGRDSGHTEGISDIVLIEENGSEGMPPRQTVVSAGLDSTIMIWSVTAVPQPLQTPSSELPQSPLTLAYDSDSTPVKTSTASLPPLRKVLSKTDVAEFARKLSPTRDASPHRLRRQPSKLALSTSITEANETPAHPKIARTRSDDKTAELDKRSPSPPPQASMTLRKQRSRNQVNKDLDTKKDVDLRRSPSPPAMSRHTTANNSRLRRPPSVPTDLRAHAAMQGRRASMSVNNDFGGMAMASDQTCRMLKTYRKKLHNARGPLDLDDLEGELEAVLQLVRHKKNKTDSPEKGVGKAVNENDMKGLTVLLERTNIS